MIRLFIKTPNQDALSIAVRAVPDIEINFDGRPSLKNQVPYRNTMLNAAAPPIIGWNTQTIASYNTYAMSERWGLITAPYVPGDKARTMSIWKRYAGMSVSPVWSLNENDTAMSNFRQTARNYTSAWSNADRPIVCVRLPQQKPAKLLDALDFLFNRDVGLDYHLMDMTVGMINRLRFAAFLVSGSTGVWLKAGNPDQPIAIFEDPNRFILVEKYAKDIPDLAHMTEEALLIHNAEQLVKYAINRSTVE